MMFAQVHCPEVLIAGELDTYLRNGWFRMGQSIFTTNFLNFRDNFYSAIWLRIDLLKFNGDRTQQKLAKKNSRFGSVIREAFVNEEKESLYARYKKNITFETSASLRHLLYGKSNRTIFNSYEVCIFDESRLIAVGYFDMGADSAAGITCFYDPDYKKFSLGKHLIYLKLEYCKQSGLQYFYPGYFVPGYSFFDYKLNIGHSNLEYLQLRTNQWFSIEKFTSRDVPYHVMKDSLVQLGQMLTERGFRNNLLKYEFFDANLVPELMGAELFDFPLVLFLGEYDSDLPDHLVVYDVCDEVFRLLKCRAVWKTNSSSPMNGTYSSQVLKTEKEVFSSAMPEEIYNRLSSEQKYQSFRTGTF
jgi:arginyl-tRNA--protein-N-Asp/Glu arginylyltransferase